MPTGRFDERTTASDQANLEETETLLLSAAPGYIASEESASPPGTVPWYKRRSTRVGAALLVIALLLLLLLLNEESTSPVKRVARAAPAPAITPRPGQIVGQGYAQLPPGGMNSRGFTLPGVVPSVVPNEGRAAQAGGGLVPFAYWSPGTVPDPVTAPVEIPAPPAPINPL